MIKDSFKKNLYANILISVITPLIILLCILIADNKNYIDKYISNTIEVELDNQVGLFNEWIETKLGTLENSKTLIEYQVKNDGFSIILKGYLNSITNVDKDIMNSFITSAEGMNIVSGNNVPKVDGRNREWYKGAMENEIFITNPYLDILTNSKVVTLSRVIDDSNGNHVGVVGIDVLFDHIINNFERMFDKVSGKIAIVDLDGNIVYVNESIDPKLLDDFLNDDNILFDMKTKLKGDNMYVYKKNIPDLKISIVIFVDGIDYINSIVILNASLVVKFLAGILGLILLITVGSNYVTRPLKNLGDVVTKLSSDESASDEEFKKLREKMKYEDLREIVNLFTEFDEHIKNNIENLDNLNISMGDMNNDIENKNEELRELRDKFSKTNQKLLGSEKKYEELVNNIMDMIFLTDEKGEILFVSKSFEGALEYEHGELVGKNIATLIDEVKSDKNLFKIFCKRDFDNIDLVLSSKNNTNRISVSASTKRIFEDSKIIMIQGICRDISYEKQMYYNYFTRNRELFIVNEISKAMTNSNDLNKILQDIADKINILMNISLCTIRILEEDSLVLKAYSGSNTRLLFKENPKLDTSHIGYSLKNRQIVSIKAADDLLFEDKQLQETMKTLNHVVYIPLYNNESSFGVITIGSEDEILSERLNVLSYLSDNASIAIEKTLLFEKLNNNYFKTIASLANAIEEKVGIMKGHTVRVAKYSVLLAKSLYLKESEIKDIEIAGLLHDIGKIGIKDAILRDSIDHEELRNEVLELHPVIGRKILEPIGLNPSILDGIYLHHKHYNLTGYPESEEIHELPLIARIISMVDDFDNLVSGSSSEGELSIEEAFEKIRQGSGELYCPEIVAIFENLVEDSIDELREISKSNYEI